MQWFIDMIVAICNAYTDQAILDAKVIPSGTIILWSGLYAVIPDGWTACDGSNGTPDLRGIFVRSAGLGFDPGDIGGATTHDLQPGTGVASGKALSKTTTTVPPFHCLWYIMKL